MSEVFNEGLSELLVSLNNTIIRKLLSTSWNKFSDIIQLLRDNGLIKDRDHPFLHHGSRFTNHQP